MGDTFSTAKLGLGVDTKQFNKEINATSTATERALEGMKLSADAFSERWGDMTRGIKDTKRIVSGILISQSFYLLSNSLISAGASALEFSRNMETAQISMEYFVQGVNKVAKAQAYLRTMNEFAARTPFTTEEVLSLSKYMQAVGVSMNTTKSFLSVITDTAAATGATEENLQRIVFGLGQIMTKGRLANEEIRQLANANIPIYEILQEQLGLTGEQISNIGREWVSADKAVVAILTGLEQRYAGAADRISNTMTGMTDTIIDDAKIIAQEAGAGIYAGLTKRMTSLRDTLDLYREIVNQGVYATKTGQVVSAEFAKANDTITDYYAGSAGLFTFLLTQMDVSGEIGTEILALIGNTKQLGAAFKELYISGKPVVTMLGRTVYASVTASTIVLTSMVETVDGAINALKKFGIVTGTTAEILGSLYITYKAAKWMAFLGQGATAAAYGLYNTTRAASYLLPTFIQASTGAKLLTTGLIGVVSYGLAAYGVFKMLNNAFAGLSTTISDGNIFPDDFSNAYEKYQQQMEEYNKQIEQYRESYDMPFSTITEGTEAATDGLADVAEASKKAAASVRKDWIASFDEVYTIPSQDSTSELLDSLADLGALLQSPAFSFPDLSSAGVAIEMPEFNMDDLFKGGLLDKEVLKPDFWKALLPIALMGGAQYLGHILAKNTPKDGPKGTGNGSPNTDPFSSTKDAAAALKEMAKEFINVERGVNDIAELIKKDKFSSLEAKEGAYRLLDERLKTANSYLDRINRQAVLAGKYDEHLASSILEEANNLSELHKIALNVDRIHALTQQAKDEGLLGDNARRDIAEIKKTLQKQYVEYTGRNGGSTPELDSIVDGIVDTKGIQGRISTLNETAKDIKDTLKSSNFKTIDIADKIKEATKLNREVLAELKSIDADTAVIAEASDTINGASKLLALQTELTGKLSDVNKLVELLSTADARGLKGYEITSLKEAIESAKKSIDNLNKAIDVQKSLISYGSPAEVDAFKVQQAVIEANRKFTAITNGILNKYLTATLKPLKMLEKYTAQMVLQEAEGKKAVTGSLQAAKDIVESLEQPFETQLRQFFIELRADYTQALESGIVLPDFGSLTQENLVKAVKQLGANLGADNAVVEAYLNTLTKNIASIDGHVNELDFLVQRAAQVSADSSAVAQLPEAIAQAATNLQVTTEEVGRTILDVLEDKLGPLEETAKTGKAFEKALTKIEKDLQKQYPEEYLKYQEEIREQLTQARITVTNKLEKLQGLQAVANSSLVKIAVNSEKADELLRITGRVPSLKPKKIGPAIRRGWAFPQEGLRTPWEESIKKGYINADVVHAGIFDAERAALDSVNVANMFGISGYGGTVSSSLISDMLKSAREINGVPQRLDTVLTIARKTFGQIFRLPILTKTNEILQGLNYTLTRGDRFYSADRLLRSDIDGVVWQGENAVAPVDAKALFSFEARILPVLQEAATYSHGIWTLSADSFDKLVKSNDAIAWQVAANATIFKKQTAWLTLLDQAALGGVGPNMAELSRFNPADPEQVAAAIKTAQQQAINQALSVFSSMENHLHIIRVSIPEEARKLVIEQGKRYAELKAQISRQSLNGGNVNDLIVPINTLGEKIGALSDARYDSSRFKAPSTGDAAINSLLRDIEFQLKSTNEGIKRLGDVSLRNLIEQLSAASKNKSVLDIIRIDLGTTATGIKALATVNVDKLVNKIIPEIKEFQAAFETRSSAQAIALSDMTKRISAGVERLDNIDMTLTFAADGHIVTTREALQSLMASDKGYTGGSNITRQAQSMLAGGAPMPVDNPYTFADVGTTLNSLNGMGAKAITDIDQIIGILGGMAKQTAETPDNPLQLGESILRASSPEAWAEWFAKTNWSKFTAASAGDFSGEGIYTTLNSLFGGKINFGKYAAYNGNATAAELGARPVETGIYGNIGNKTGYWSSEQLNALANGLGLVAMFANINSMLKTSKETSKLFKESILPTIATSEQGAAEERAERFGLTGFDSGIFGGITAKAFLEEYSSMTDQERLFWGGLMSGKGPEFSLSPTDYDYLKSALSDSFSAVDLTNNLTGLSNKELLQNAMEAGIENSPLAALTDYIVKSGDTSSDIAKAFYKKYGDYMDTVVKPAYGMDNSWYAAVDALLEGAKDTPQISAILSQIGGSIKSAADIPLQFKSVFDTLISQLQDSVEARILPVLKAQQQYNTGTGSPLEGDYTRVIAGVGASNISDAAKKQLSDILGITLEDIAGGLSTISIDAAAIGDNITGWVQKLPDTISLDGTTISTQDAQILAQAGIQINGDGTVTFMKAMNENTTGTERLTTLTIDDVSTNALSKLSSVGLSFDFSEGNNNLNLDIASISKNMQSAMFRLSTDLSGQVSDSMNEALSGLGVVLDSGYFQITNKAVLNGKMTISEYIASMGKAADELSPEVRAALERIDAVIAQGGIATQETVAEWADGIVVPSPLKADELTDELIAAFATIGVTFEEQGNQLMMVVNRVGNQLGDGMTLIPEETWNKVNEDVRTALQALGVTVTTEAGFVTVDLSTVMESGVGDVIELFANRPDLWNQIPQAVIDSLAAAGIEVTNGMISINTEVMNGLVNVDNQWFGYWNDIPTDIIVAMGAAKLNYSTGLLSLEQITESTKIPEDVNTYIVKPFSELPQEIQDRLTGGDDSVKKSLEGSQFLITSATETAFVGAIQAVHDNFGQMNDEADDGAKQLAETIASALAEVQKLNNITVKKNYNPLDNEAKVAISGSPGNYTVKYGGQTYKNIIAPNEKAAVKMVEQLTGIDIPGYAYGGIINKDGLYRAGEVGKVEGIIPLENKSSLRVIGNTIAANTDLSLPSMSMLSELSSSIVDDLRAAIGLKNAGITYGGDSVAAQQTAQTVSDMVQDITQHVLENVLPILANSQSQKPIAYIEYLIANDHGIRELNKRMEVIRAEETARRG